MRAGTLETVSAATGETFHLSVPDQRRIVLIDKIEGVHPVRTNASVGNRWGNLSALVTFNYQNSNSQPLGFATTASNTLAGVASGLIQQPSRTGGVANVMGATGLLHTEMTNLKGKFALDITPWLTATYTIGFWNNDQSSDVDSYLRTASGAATFGPQSASNPFASGRFTLNQQNLANALAFKTDTRAAGTGTWSSRATTISRTSSAIRSTSTAQSSASPTPAASRGWTAATGRPSTQRASGARPGLAAHTR